MEYEIDQYAIDYQFPSCVFRRNRDDFLDVVKPVFYEYVEEAKKEMPKADTLYPAIMTKALSKDERIEAFTKYVSDISWDILNRQGYDMDLFYTDASDMWGQYHPHASHMEEHIHGYQSVLSGFYFLDVPEDSCKIVLKDPRTVKIYSDLPIKQAENSELLISHSSVFYDPKPGDFLFTNSWLPHMYTKNKSNNPFNFIHINVRVVFREGIEQPKTEQPEIIW